MSVGEDAVPGVDGAGASVIGTSPAHDGAALHVQGRARYTDDLPEPTGTLYAAVGCSEYAHARLLVMDLSAVRAASGVVAVITAADIPGENDCGPIQHDAPVLAASVTGYVGQPLFAVAATSVRAARLAVALAELRYEALEAVLDIDDAIGQDRFVLPATRLERGDAPGALDAAAQRIEGRLHIGGQEHFYLEGQVALAIPGEAGQMQVLCATQSPGVVQAAVGRCLGLRYLHDVRVESGRLGGSFGGKATQATGLACIAALLAARTQRAVKLRVDRDDDLRMTGKRHEVRADHALDFDSSGGILAWQLTLAARCGYSADVSGPVNDAAMLHADNAYYLPQVRIESLRCRTNTVPATAFRGAAAPAVLAIENAIDALARRLGMDALDVRLRNLYGGPDRDLTPYGQRVTDLPLVALMEALAASADYRARRLAIAAHNRDSPVLKRGLALTPVKFGVGRPGGPVGQAAALLQLYPDGSVHLGHGGTDMGQGLQVKVVQVVADELGVQPARIRSCAADSSRAPAVGPLGAVGVDLHAGAARAAARRLRKRLLRFAARQHGVPVEAVALRGDMLHVAGTRLDFETLVRDAHRHGVALGASAQHLVPDAGAGAGMAAEAEADAEVGHRFQYFACGAAVTEALVDTLTGEYRLTRVDILQDCGQSLNPAIDRGQIEGGYLQGVGWLTSESLHQDAQGRLHSTASSTYKIPASSDWPEQCNVQLYQHAAAGDAGIHGARAVGEAPLMLAVSAFLAIKDGLSALADHRLEPALDAPATPEAVALAAAALRASLATTTQRA